MSHRVPQMKNSLAGSQDFPRCPWCEMLQLLLKTQRSPIAPLYENFHWVDALVARHSAVNLAFAKVNPENDPCHRLVWGDYRELTVWVNLHQVQCPCTSEFLITRLEHLSSFLFKQTLQTLESSWYDCQE